MYCGIEHILGNHRIDTVDRLRMSLPISLSGLGLPLAQNVAPAAYCGSKIQTLHLQSKILQKTNKVDETRLISDGKELFHYWIIVLIC